MKAINSDLVFVGNGVSKGCCCGGGGAGDQLVVFRSVWDRLCRQLFGAIPPGMDTDDQLPDVDIWKDGVAMVDDSYPYTFTVASDGEEIPKKADVIEYKGKYYVIGAVE